MRSSSFGAGFPLSATDMYNKLGLGQLASWISRDRFHSILFFLYKVDSGLGFMKARADCRLVR
jgi:hypothetical protein